ncbi:MAG: PorT family protein [Bacteroidia bacterium]|nr:PorT family protein [Bacteroidia bacterium]MCF8426509.1 PorT family protein [Bacteroidia bacterium]
MKSALRIVLLFIFTSPRLLWSQNCAEKIDLANKMLEAREYANAINLVQPCLDSNQSKSIRWHAYRVQSIAYSFMGRTDSAQWAAKELLNINPGYVPDKLNNPKAFINLVKSHVDVKPFTFYTNFVLGSNFSQAKVIKLYGVNLSTKTYIPQIGFQIGEQLGMFITPSLSVDVGALVYGSSYAIDYDIPNWRLRYQENMLSIQVPVSAQYLFQANKRFRFGPRLGFYKQYLVTSENSFKSTYLPTNEHTNLNRELSYERRNKWQTGGVLGLTGLYKLGRGHLNFQISYSKSFTDFNKPDTRYNAPDLMYNYFYLDDNLRMNNWSFSFGYTHILHKAVGKFE